MPSGTAPAQGAAPLAAVRSAAAAPLCGGRQPAEKGVAPKSAIR